MFVGGKPDRRAENYGDAAVEVWCEGSGTAPHQAPAAAPLTAAPTHAPDLAADLPGLAAYSANRAAWRAACGEEHSGGALPPPFLRDPRSECPRLDTPFVTDEVGGLPVLPDNLEQALAAYLPESEGEAEGGAPEAPEVGIVGSGKAAASSLRRLGLGFGSGFGLGLGLGSGSGLGLGLGSVTLTLGAQGRAARAAARGGRAGAAVLGGRGVPDAAPAAVVAPRGMWACRRRRGARLGALVRPGHTGPGRDRYRHAADVRP